MCVEREILFLERYLEPIIAVVSFLVVYFNQGKKVHQKIKSRSSKSKVGNKSLVLRLNESQDFFVSQK